MINDQVLTTKCHQVQSVNIHVQIRKHSPTDMKMHILLTVLLTFLTEVRRICLNIKMSFSFPLFSSPQCLNKLRDDVKRIFIFVSVRV